MDSTPDLGHREQLSEVIRFVDVNFETKEVKFRESFLGVIHLRAKDAAAIEQVIIERLQEEKIPLSDCRSQCYDNASVMAGHISGVQERILARNHRALFLNCDNHSLNLAGVHSASQDAVVVTFFGTIEAIYTFFSNSILRWDKLKVVVSITFKRYCETRWSSKMEAVKAVFSSFDSLVDLLVKMSDDCDSSQDTRTGSESLLQAVLSVNILVLLYLWHEILGKIDRIQRRFQDPTMNFAEASGQQT